MRNRTSRFFHIFFLIAHIATDGVFFGEVKEKGGARGWEEELRWGKQGGSSKKLF